MLQSGVDTITQPLTALKSDLVALVRTLGLKTSLDIGEWERMVDQKLLMRLSVRLWPGRAWA